MRWLRKNIPTGFDETITGISLKAAREYVERQLGSDEPDDNLRAHAVRYLLLRFEQNPEEFVYRSEIISYLEQAV